MAKARKNFIQPGSLATKKKTQYEKDRDKRIKENQLVFKAHGIQKKLNSLRGLSPPNYANEKGEGTGSELEDEDDNSDDSLDSFQQEVQYE